MKERLRFGKQLGRLESKAQGCSQAVSIALSSGLCCVPSIGMSTITRFNLEIW